MEMTTEEFHQKMDADRRAILQISKPALEEVLQLSYEVENIKNKFEKIKDTTEQKVKDLLIAEFYKKTGIKTGDFIKCKDTICYVDGFKISVYLYLNEFEHEYLNHKNNIYFEMLIRPMLPSGKFSKSLGGLFSAKEVFSSNPKGTIYTKITNDDYISELQHILSKSGKSKNHDRQYLGLGGATYFL